MTDRRPRFRRAPDGSGLVLTERDTRIVLACWEYRWLTRHQLQQVVDLGGVSRANRRLRQLFDAEFLARLRVGTVNCGLQPVYVAGPAAVPLVADHTQEDPALVRTRLREDTTASALLLPHDLQVNDVRISLERAIAAHPRLALEGWRHAQACYDRYALGQVLRPDGFFRLRHSETHAAFFLEVDRGTVDLGRWAAKMERYLDYRDSGAYARRYGLQRFRVLVTAPSMARVTTLRAATRARTERGVWFAPVDTVLAAAAEEPVWSAVGSNETRSLRQLGEGR